MAEQRRKQNVVDVDNLRRFADRDRASVERLKRAYWIRMYREQGGLATWRAGVALFEHARRVRPDFPTADDRAADLAHHVELKGLLDRASRALALR